MPHECLGRLRSILRLCVVLIAAATTPSESKTIVCGFQDDADPAGLNANAREIHVDDQYGNYTIYLNPRARLDQLTSDTYRILHNNVWYDSAGKGTFKLKLKEVVVTQPDSSMKKISIYWTWGNTDANVWVTSFKCDQVPSQGKNLMFEQFFPNGLSHAPLRDNEKSIRNIDMPSTVFPSFVAPRGIRVATFFGQNAAMSTHYGKWPDAYMGGYLGGPVALFSNNDNGNKGVDSVVILSAFSHPMLGTHNLIDPDKPVLGFGMGGLIQEIPEKFSIEFILSEPTEFSKLDINAGADQSAGKIARAFLQWGNKLIENSYGKFERTLPDANAGYPG